MVITWKASIFSIEVHINSTIRIASIDDFSTLNKARNNLDLLNVLSSDLQALSYLKGLNMSQFSMQLHLLSLSLDFLIHCI